MGLLLPYLITKHLQEWFFIFVLKSLARTAQRYEFPRKIISKNNISHSHTESFSEYPPQKKTRNQLPFLIVGFSSLIMVLT